MTLQRFWIEFEPGGLSSCFGVTALDIADALVQVQAFVGPESLAPILAVIEGIDVARLDHRQVLPSILSPEPPGVWFPPSGELLALCGAIEARLIPLGFQRASLVNLGATRVGGQWVTPEVLVAVWLEPGWQWGFAQVGRRLPEIALQDRSAATMVSLEDLIESRGLLPSAPESAGLSGRDPSSIADWAEAIGRDLGAIVDVLVGRALDEIDRLVSPADVMRDAGLDRRSALG